MSTGYIELEGSPATIRINRLRPRLYLISVL